MERLILEDLMVIMEALQAVVTTNEMRLRLFDQRVRTEAALAAWAPDDAPVPAITPGERTFPRRSVHRS